MNMMTATECLLEMCEEHLELEDYQSGVPRWCTGCGDNAILAAVQRLCRDEGLRPEKTVFVSGIGCSSRFPHYMKTYGFHGIHGRALPVAEGVKMSRPDLDVFVNTGDGDCCSIGAAHWIHALRYSMNLTVFLHDNQIYGLTKMQASPTSPIGTKSNTTPRGSVLEALNPLTVTLGVQNVSFVAQAVDWVPELLYDIVKAAYHHRGLSFVRIVSAAQWMPKLRPVAATRPGQVLHHARAAGERRARPCLPQPARARPARPRRGWRIAAARRIPVGISTTFERCRATRTSAPHLAAHAGH
jgi:2-oxoglutarate ferredoxin oxidoreductase subunit beta